METSFKRQKWRFYNLWKVRCYIEPGGVRIGTAEIYRQVEKINFIRESLVVGQEKDGDVKILLFVVMNNKNKLSDSDINFIKKKLKKIVLQNTYLIK